MSHLAEGIKCYGKKPRKKIQMKSSKMNNVTVQGLITPVPAALGSVQAGYQSSRSSDCNDSPVSLAGVSDNATSTENISGGTQRRCEVDPFRKSSKIGRSPQKPSGTALGMVNANRAAGVSVVSAATISDTPRSSNARNAVITSENSAPNTGPGSMRPVRPPANEHTSREQPTTPHLTADSGISTIAVVPNEGVVNATVEGSPQLALIRKMREMEEDAIAQCKIALSGMQRATNRQKNISNEVKVGISKLSELLDVITSYRRTWKVAEEKRMHSSARKKATEQMVDAVTPHTAKSKRPATSPAASESRKKVRAKETSADANKSQRESEGEWQTVTRKGKQKKPKKLAVTEKTENTKKSRLKRARSEAVVIRPAGGRSYSDVLKDLRNKIPSNDSSGIKTIRKTMTGAILLEFRRGERIKPEFVQQLRDTVQQSDCIRELKPTATVEIRDLDSLTTQEEVETAIRKLLIDKEVYMSTKITAPNRREQVRAFVTLSAEGAAKLSEIGNVQIGWIRARIRACESLRRCYRCLETGHTQTRCTGPDRRNVCIRCGESGHKMKECKAAPRCIHCADIKRDRTDHLLGSRRCPLLRRS